MDLFSILLTFIEGMLTFVSPCILPMVPIYITYLAGASMGNNLDSRKKLFLNTGGFILGFFLVFLALGLTITALSSLLASNKDIIRKMSGVIMVLFGLNFIGVLKLKVFDMEKKFGFNVDNLTPLKSVFFGMFFAFGWTSCTGAYLGSALTYAGSAGTAWQGVLLILIYSSGLGIPFLLTALLFEKLKGVIKFLQRKAKIITIISGFILIFFGILVLTDSLRNLARLTW